jgi:hypothetical protein
MKGNVLQCFTKVHLIITGHRMKGSSTHKFSKSFAWVLEQERNWVQLLYGIGKGNGAIVSADWEQKDREEFSQIPILGSMS